MDALSIHPTWAWAIAQGHKRIENRAWAPRRLGTLAIHASTRDTSRPRASAFLESLGIEPPASPASAAIVAVVDVVKVTTCRPLPLFDLALDSTPDPTPDLAPDLALALARSLARSRSLDPWEVGPFVWHLTDVQRLETPVPCRGNVRLWALPPNVEAAVRRQLRG